MVPQLPIVLRNNLNLLLTQAFARGDLGGLRDMTAKARRGTYLAMAGILAIAVIGFRYLFVSVVVGGDFSEAAIHRDLLQGLDRVRLFFRSTCISCSAATWRQSGFKAAVLVTNVALNLALIPLGALDAASSQWPPPGLSALYVRHAQGRASAA